jgi:hypothetical protein
LYLATSRFAWLKTDQLQGSAGRQQTEVLCLVGPGVPRCLQQLCFCSSLCCIIVGEVSDTLRWRICADGWQLEVLCL